MNAETTTLHTSSSYSIIDFKCKSAAGENSGVEYQPDFSLSFTRTGNFIYNVFRDTLDVHYGRILLNKPDHEHTVKHVHHVPDECTCFTFRPDFYESTKDRYPQLASRFFNNNDVHSLLMKSDAETEYLHYQILRSLKSNRYSGLLMDSLVYEIVELALGKLSHEESFENVPTSMKKNHLETVERARDYINENYTRDLSLTEIADNSYVSPFHFSRIFKTFTSYSPHQYLIDTRLKNAEVLVRNTDLPITEICLSSGFASLEHFSSAFSRKFGLSPSKYRGKAV